jgi:mannose-1-phosphate guanylyltransferase
MKAVVLVGGFGTRMRPLTETVKKELLPLVDRPVLDHTLDRLVRHGVDEVVMSSPYLEEAFAPFIESRRGSPSITWVTEPAPLGTGGAIVHALPALGDDPFLALNGDILTDLDLTSMADRHRDRGAAVSIALHHVEDARPFGLVETDGDGRVLAFREKPEDPAPGDVNAGTYLLDPSRLRTWSADREISVEREIFPALIDDGALVVGFASAAYWIDLGTPQQYLQAHADMLAGRLDGVRYAAPWVAPSASVADDASLDEGCAVGPGCVVSSGSVITGSVLHAGASVGAGARVVRSILGPGARVGEGADLVGSVLGEGAVVAPRASLRDARVPG